MILLLNGVLLFRWVLILIFEVDVICVLVRLVCEVICWLLIYSVKVFVVLF